MPKLIIRQQGYEDTFKIDKPKVSIGRSSRNDVCIADPFASRLHAEIRQEGDHVTLVDLGSANGTYLNGQRVTGSIGLQPMDRVRIGETEIEYQTEAVQPQSTPTVYLSGPIAEALPVDTITTSLGNRTTSDLLSTIQSATGLIGASRPSGGAAAQRTPSGL